MKNWKVMLNPITEHFAAFNEKTTQSFSCASRHAAANLVDYLNQQDARMEYLERVADGVKQLILNHTVKP